VHSFNLNTWDQQAFLLKLDLDKAFDRLEWNFIAEALSREGYSGNFIRHLVILLEQFGSLQILL
jgi:hypothetical protein